MSAHVVGRAWGRLGAALALSLSVGCAPASSTQNPPVVPPDMVPTPYGVAVHQPARVKSATVTGRVPADLPIDLVLGIRLPGGRKALFDRLARREAPISPARFAEVLGPSQADYDEVARYVEAHGLTVTRRTDSRTTLTVNGPAGAVEKAFGTRLDLYSDALGTFRAPSAELTALAPGGALYGLVDTIVGLDDAQRYRPRSIPGGPVPPASPQAGPLDPATLRSMYGVDQTSGQGAGETIAILGTGYPPSPRNDVDKFIQRYGLPTNRTAQYTQVFVGGPNRDPDSLANNEYGENVLDIDMVLGIAPLASVVHVITAQNGGGLFADGIVFTINNVPQAHAVTVSYGLCERLSSYEATLLDQLFAQALAQGQTWFFASGDNGTDACQDGSGNKVLSVNWPPSSPHVVGVGGTTLASSNEIGWSFSGGGLSELFPKPDFQKKGRPVAYPNVDAREVPDVGAMAGDPGLATVFGNMVYGFQGTSAATPIWAAMYAIVDANNGGTGFPDMLERLYALGTSTANTPGAVFRDIVGGNNAGGGAQGYAAIAGFDLVTGWGAAHLKQLVQAWGN